MSRYAKWELTQQSTLCSGDILRPGAGAIHRWTTGYSMRLPYTRKGQANPPGPFFVPLTGDQGMIWVVRSTLSISPTISSLAKLAC